MSYKPRVLDNLSGGTGVASPSTVTSWTPVLSFGGASVGITYSSQSGGYFQIGQLLFFDMSLVLTNKGSSTGSAVISGLPAISPGRISIIVISASTLTYSGQVNGRIINGSSDINLDVWASTGARTQLTDAAFANTSFVQMSGQIILT